MKRYFFRNVTLQYVNKSIVNENLVVNMALKTAQFLSKNGQETGTSLLFNFHSVT